MGKGTPNNIKKIVVTIPMSVDEFSPRRRGWFTQDGQPTAFTKRMMEKGGNDEQQALRYWLAHQGNIDGLQGPKPLEVARGFSHLSPFCGGFGLAAKMEEPFCPTSLAGRAFDLGRAFLVGGPN
jgi:hypothetical protein